MQKRFVFRFYRPDDAVFDEDDHRSTTNDYPVVNVVSLNGSGEQARGGTVLAGCLNFTTYRVAGASFPKVAYAMGPSNGNGVAIGLG
jgi:hypothetical protein